MGSRLTSEQVWHELAKASFAVVSYVTPAGEPGSSGVVYKTVGRRLYLAVAPDSWKARHIKASGRVAVTVPVGRGARLVERQHQRRTCPSRRGGVVHNLSWLLSPSITDTTGNSWSRPTVVHQHQ